MCCLESRVYLRGFGFPTSFPFHWLERVALKGEHMADKMKELYEKVRLITTESNAKYKAYADKRRLKTFKQGDMVMVYQQKE